MMRGFKTMFLGFLVMFLGAALLLALAASIPSSINPLLPPNPLISLFISNSYSGLAYIERIIAITRTEEIIALIFILVGFLIALVGYFRKE